MEKDIVNKNENSEEISKVLEKAGNMLADTFNNFFGPTKDIIEEYDSLQTKLKKEIKDFWRHLFFFIIHLLLFYVCSSMFGINTIISVINFLACMFMIDEMIYSYFNIKKINNNLILFMKEHIGEVCLSLSILSPLSILLKRA